MSRKITKDFLNALRDTIDAAGSQLAFERKSGVRQSTINKMLNNRTSTVTDAMFEKLYPFLQPYLKADADIFYSKNGNVNSIKGRIVSGAVQNSGRIGRVHASDELTAQELYDRIVECEEIPADIKVIIYKLLK